jgi:hypothetical protein
MTARALPAAARATGRPSPGGAPRSLDPANCPPPPLTSAGR